MSKKDIKEEIEKEEVSTSKNCECDDCECGDCECDDCECDDCECDNCECDDCECESDDSKCETIRGNYENKIKELEDKMVRIQADNINFRKRKEEEMMSFVKYANKDLLLEILPVLDNFERAIKMDNENLDDDE